MSQNQRQENYIKIDEVIEKAKERGVDFGNANPRSRLRYYAKLDLLPPAERKVFKGNQPTGAYPEGVVDLLVDIDQEIEKGKSIKQVAEEKNQKNQESRIKNQKENQESEITDQEKKQETQEKEKAKKDFEEDLKKEQREHSKESQKSQVSYQAPPFTLIPTYQKEDSSVRTTGETDREPRAKKIGTKVFSFLTATLKFGSLALLVAVFGYILGSGVLAKKMPGGLSASLLPELSDDGSSGNQLAQINQGDSGGGALPSVGSQLFLSTPDPYLTINVETDINAPLNLRSTTTPTLSFHQGGSEGVLTTGSLTADRNYTLPDQSGTVCLSTGNCFGGQVTSQEAAEGQLARFAGPNTIEGSSIQDLYQGGTLLTISEQGNLEVDGSIYASAEEGQNAILGSQDSPLQIQSGGETALTINEAGDQINVQGEIQADGDICTDQGGGKCLSDMTAGGTTFIGGGGGGEVDGSGSSGYLARWTSSDEISDSALYQSGNNIGIGNTSPSSKLDVSGTVSMTGFKMPTNATSGYVLTAATSGVGTWQEVSGLPSATTGQTLYYDGSEWATSSLLTNTGSVIGIGTTSTSSLLTVDGTINITGTTTLNGVSYNWPSADGSTNQVLETDGAGSLSWTDVEGTADADWYISTSTVSSTTKQMHSNTDVSYVGIGTTAPTETLTVVGTSGTPQLSLNNGSENLQVLVNATNTTITASGDLVLNTDGQIITNATLVDASNATVSAATFQSADATVRSPDEYVLRGSIPIFSYENPAQTATSNYRVIADAFATSSLSNATPEIISGATRTYAFLINFSDTLATTATSSWRINKSSNETFSFAGQNINSDNLLQRGHPHLTDFYNLPDNNWYLEVNPKGEKIMVHNILLLVYDKVE
ncbi:MAG: hypothetical protein V5A57_01200 [Candidatus Paceibacterota bacterium]